MAAVISGGWLPDTPKAGDSSFDSLRSRLSPRAAGGEHILPLRTPVSFQGNLRACSANVTADALEILMSVRGEVTQLSRLFIYYNARTYHNAAAFDGGTFLRMTFEAIKRLGVCPEELWPYVESKVNLRPPLRAYREANDYKVTAFYRIDKTGPERVNALEAALLADHPVAFGTKLSKAFESYAGENDDAFDPSSAPTGRHAMLFCGVRRRGGKREFMVRNSWGTSWGREGYAWLSEAYVMAEYTRDLWVPTLMPPL